MKYLVMIISAVLCVAALFYVVMAVHAADTERDGHMIAAAVILTLSACASLVSAHCVCGAVTPVDGAEHGS